MNESNSQDQVNLNQEYEERKKRNTIDDAIRAANLEQQQQSANLNMSENQVNNMTAPILDNGANNSYINQNKQNYMYAYQNIPGVINQRFNYQIPTQYPYGYQYNTQRTQITPTTNTGFQNYNQYQMYPNSTISPYNTQLNYMSYPTVGNQNQYIYSINATYNGTAMMPQQTYQFQTPQTPSSIQTQLLINKQQQQPPPPPPLQQQQQQQSSIIQGAEENHQEQRKTRWNTPIVVPDSLYHQFNLPVPEQEKKDQAQYQNNNINANNAQGLAAGRGGGKLEKKEWPPELVQYTTKCFEKCQNNKERKIIEKQLKNIITIAINNHELQTRDWKNYPQPLLPREKNTNNLTNQSSSELMTVSQMLQNKTREIQANGGSLNVPNEQEQNNINNKAKDTEKEKLDIQQRIKSQQDISQLLKRPGQLIQDKDFGIIKKNVKINPKPTRELNIIKKQGIIETINTEIDDSEYLDFEKLANKWKITGTCQDLEKPYLRLTKAPEPSQVRPEHILKKSLKLLLDKWKNQECQYEYIQEQFRSIRQDLIIQHIKNDFTVSVCEHNARICLESRDVMQFSQCCATLFDMYKEGIPGNQAEFTCYKIIHHLLKNEQTQLVTLISQLSAKDTIDPMMIYAFDIVKAVQQGNIYKFFKMYRDGPMMTQYVIDIFLTKMRIWGLLVICKSFGTTMDIEKLTTLMSFIDVVQTKEFILGLGAKLDAEEKNIILKDSFKLITEYQNTIN